MLENVTNKLQVALRADRVTGIGGSRWDEENIRAIEACGKSKENVIFLTKYPGRY